MIDVTENCLEYIQFVETGAAQITRRVYIICGKKGCLMRKKNQLFERNHVLTTTPYMYYGTLPRKSINIKTLAFACSSSQKKRKGTWCHCLWGAMERKLLGHY